MKSYLTEAEQANQNQQYAYQILRMAQSGSKTFSELYDELPFALQESERSTFSYVNFNHTFVNIVGEADCDKLLKAGLSYNKEITEPDNFSYFMSKIRKFEKTQDFSALCSYFQRVRVKGVKQWYSTHKMFKAKGRFITLLEPLNQMGHTGTILRDILGETCVNRNGWQLFRTLTRREKEVMQLLAQGMTSREISDQLSISKFTVDTHRKRLFSKLEVKNYAQLFKVTQGFQLLDLEGKPYHESN